MKKTIILITIVIFIISCKVTPTAPENEYLTTANNYKSSFPILGTAYLWVIIGNNNEISLKFGPDGKAAPTDAGEKPLPTAHKSLLYKTHDHHIAGTESR